MASILKRKRNKKTTYLVFIRRKGIKPILKSFINKSDAQKWARGIERELDQGRYIDYGEASKITLGEVMQRYIREDKHKKIKSWRMHEFRIGILLKDTIADTNLLRLSSKHLSEFKDRKRKEVGPSTWNKYLSLISVVIDTAMKDWGIYLPNNPVRNADREKEPRPRDRTLVDDEYQRLLQACDQMKQTRFRKGDTAIHLYLKSMIIFSVETAIRQGELLAMRYDQFNFDKRTLYIPETKNGEPRTIPLSTKAIKIIQSVPRRIDGKVFPLSCDSLKFWFGEAKREAKISGFRWHDLRRYACSLLFEKGLSVPELQLVSGHKDPRVLLNTYTALSAEKIAIKLKERG
jgi:integrase